MRSLRRLRRRVHMAWAVSGHMPPLSGCLIGSVWYRLAAFFALLFLRPFCAFALAFARFYGDAEYIEEMQHAVAQLTPLLFLED